MAPLLAILPVRDPVVEPLPIWRVPAAMVVLPAQVLAAVRMRVPRPVLVSAPVPVMPCAKVVVLPAVSRVAPAAPRVTGRVAAGLKLAAKARVAPSMRRGAVAAPRLASADTWRVPARRRVPPA